MITEALMVLEQRQSTFNGNPFKPVDGSVEKDVKEKYIIT